jgi:hypothetical protein
VETIARSSLPFEEDRLWIESIRPWLAARSIQGNALDLAHYVTTEMLNNVRDHSESTTVEILGAVNPKEFVLHIKDSGIGLFQRLATGLGLAGPREAVAEISKGKRTTDPAHHTGQGIFFSSKVCEWFSVEANGFGVSFKQGNSAELLLFPNRPDNAGTNVKFKITLNTKRTLRQVFDEFCPQPDIGFTRTVIGLQLMDKADGSLISRSQGRRLMAGLENFRDIVLDFDSVASIGQGFADEVFRVWRNAHPSISLRTINANSEVSAMLKQMGHTG